jgi:hypothetical protein
MTAEVVNAMLGAEAPENNGSSEEATPAIHLRGIPVLETALRALFGRDVFLSYSHRDGTDYVRKLAKALESARGGKRLNCFFDQRSAILDARMPREIVRVLRRSSMLVVVATPGAASSTSVRTEISAFAETRRPIVLLECQSSEAGSEALRRFKADLAARAAVVFEEPPTAAVNGPTDPALDHIRDSVNFVRHDRRVAGVAMAAAAVLAAVAGVALWNGEEKNAARNSSLIPGITVVERKTTLDLAEWHPTTNIEVSHHIRRSKAVSTNHFQIKRTKAIPTFVHIMGTSSGIMPEFRNQSRFRAWLTPRKKDEMTRAPNEWSINFDISSVPLGHKVDIDFTVVFWNAFQNPLQWWGGFRILHQTGLAVYTVKFPDPKRPHPETLAYRVKEDAATETPFDETPDSSVELDGTGRVASVTWRKYAPLGDTSYRIGWDWTND